MKIEDLSLTHEEMVFVHGNPDVDLDKEAQGYADAATLKAARLVLEWVDYEIDWTAESGPQRELIRAKLAELESGQ